MASGVIGDLVVRIGGDNKDFVQKAQESKKWLGQIGREARETTNDLGKFALGLGAAGAALVTSVAVNSALAAKEIKNLSAVANTSTDIFTGWAHGAKTVGIEHDKLGDILKDTNDKFGDFLSSGAGGAADFFENIAPKVGVTAEQFRNLSGPDALQLYVSSLEKANLSQSEMTFYMEALASDSTALLPLLKNNGAAMREQADEAERLGLILSQVEADNLAEMGVAIEKNMMLVSAFSDSFSAKLAPAVTAATKVAEDMIEEFGGVDDIAEVAFNNVVGAAAFVADAVEGVRRVVDVAGSGLALFALGTKEAFLATADAIINRPVEAINELISYLNRFTGAEFEPISFSGLGQSVQDELQLTRLAVEAGYSDIQEILAAPLPSTQFEKFYNEAVETSKKVKDKPIIIEPAIGTSLANAALDNIYNKVVETNQKVHAENLRANDENATIQPYIGLSLPPTRELDDYYAKVVETNQKIFEENLRASEENATLGGPMASEKFDEYYAKVVETNQRIFEENLRANEENRAIQPFLSMEAPPTEGLDNYFTKVVETNQKLHEERLRANQLELDTTAEHDALIDEMIAESQHSRIMAEREFAELQAQIDEQQYQGRKAALGSTLSDLSSIMDSESRSMFEIGKTAAMSNTAISTVESAQKSFDALAGIPIIGPTLGTAAAIAASLNGYQRVQAIGARGFNKSGAIPGAGGGGAAPTPAAAPVSSGDSGGDRITYIQGLDPSHLFSGEQVLGLVNGALENGGRLVSI